VVEQIRKASHNPITLLVAAALFGIGGGGATNLLNGRGGESAEETCRADVKTHADNVRADRAEALELHSKSLDGRFASKTEVATLTVKIDQLRETVAEMRDELRDRRRPALRRQSDD
jgi:hypothetical protein